MKKILICFCILVLVFTGCNISNNDLIDNADNSEENIKLLYESEYGNTYTCSELPFEIPYGENLIRCVSVELYQDESNYGYYIYGIVSIDFSNLSDKDLYWLEKEKELDVSLMIKNEANSDDYIHLSHLCKTENERFIYYIFYSLKEYRYSFDNSHATLFFNIDNGELYDSYIHSFDIEKVSDFSSISQDIQQAINEGYQRQIKIWEDVLDSFK